jgi:hypothetical protein
MITKRIRAASGLYLLMAVLSLVCSCSRPASDPKGNLIGSLKGADVKGYVFALNEDEAQTTSSLTNNAVTRPITLGKGDADLILRYTRVEDIKTKTTNTYKSEVIKKGSSLALVVTEMGTDKVIDNKSFPAAGPTCQPPGTFDSLEACISQFNCADKGAIQCEANRTCKPQFAGATCCLKNGNIFAVDFIIKPNTIRCSILGSLTPDLEGLALSKN